MQTTRKKNALCQLSQILRQLRRKLSLCSLFHWDALAVLLAGVFPGVTWRPWGRTRAGLVPASYPTASTRRLMSPVADARTGPKAYAAVTGIFELPF